jgi:hypothetical protein
MFWNKRLLTWLDLTWLSVEKLSSMPDKEFMKHVRLVVDSLGSGEKGPPSQRRVQLLHYAASIASTPACATALVLSNVLAVCGRQIRDCPNQDVWVSFGLLIELRVYRRCSLISTLEFPRHGRMLSLFDPVIGQVNLWHLIEAKKQTLKKGSVTPHWRLVCVNLLCMYVLWSGLFLSSSE